MFMVIILDQLVNVIWRPANKRYFNSLGYELTFYGDSFVVKLNELKKNSTLLVKAQCDFCMQAILRSYGSLNGSIDGTIVDSRIDRDIHNLLLENNVNAMCIQNKQDVENSFINDDYGERYVPD